MAEEQHHAVDENILPLDDTFIEKCKNMNADLDEQVEGLMELSKMPFFPKLTEDKRTRYVKEYKIKQALKSFSEGKKPADISERQWKHILKLRFQELTRDAYKEYNSLKKKNKRREKGTQEG